VNVIKVIKDINVINWTIYVLKIVAIEVNVYLETVNANSCMRDISAKTKSKVHIQNSFLL